MLGLKELHPRPSDLVERVGSGIAQDTLHVHEISVIAGARACIRESQARHSVSVAATSKVDEETD